MNLNWLLPLTLCTTAEVDPNESCALLLFPKKALELISTYAAPSNPTLMFTCKRASRIGKRLAMFQRYLAWKYQIPELQEISYHPQLNYLRKVSRLGLFQPENNSDQASPGQLQNDLMMIECRNLSAFNEIFLKLLRLHQADANRGLLKRASSKRLAWATFAHLDWGEFFQVIDELSMDGAFEAYLPQMFAFWYKNSPRAFNNHFFLEEGGHLWTGSQIESFIRARGTRICKSLPPARLVNFFKALIEFFELKVYFSDSALKKKVIKKIFPYLRAHGASMNRKIYLTLMAALDPKFDFKIQYLEEYFIFEEYRFIAQLLMDNGNFKALFPIYYQLSKIKSGNFFFVYLDRMWDTDKQRKFMNGYKRYEQERKKP